MGIKVLWLVSDFPVNLESARNLYSWHPLQSLKKIEIVPVVLNTESWKPFSKKEIQKTQFPVEIINRYYFSIPRHYFRAISNRAHLASVVPAIKKLHKIHQFDVIHAHGEINGLAAVEAAKALNIASVITIHGIDMCQRVWSGYAGKMFQKALNQTDRIIYVGGPLQKHFQKIISNKYSIIYNGFKAPNNNNPKIKSNIIRIISVGNLHEGKGIDLTLLALSKLKSNNINNWKYTIIGDGDQKKLCENIVTKFELESQVEFKGACTQSQVYAYLQQSDIFCLPSYREAFGIAYLEAMAHGLLTIGIKGQGPEAFIEHGKTGFLAEPNSVDSLVEILGFAINNFEAMQPIAHSGKQHVLENFTWEKHAEKLLSVYREVCV